MISLRKQHGQNQKGFTIIELLLATSFFTAVMLMVVAGYVQINRSYTRGLTIKEVQNSARVIIDDVSRAIRDVDAADVIPISDNRMLIGETCYVWIQESPTVDDFLIAEFFAVPPDADNPQPELIRLIKTTQPGACYAQIGKTVNTTVLLEERLISQDLSIERIGTSNSFSIRLIISTDALANPEDFSSLGLDARCVVQSGDQFCHVVELSTVVTARN